MEGVAVLPFVAPSVNTANEAENLSAAVNFCERGFVTPASEPVNGGSTRGYWLTSPPLPSLSSPSLPFLPFLLPSSCFPSISTAFHFLQLSPFPSPSSPPPSLSSSSLSSLPFYCLPLAFLQSLLLFTPSSSLPSHSFLYFCRISLPYPYILYFPSLQNHYLPFLQPPALLIPRLSYTVFLLPPSIPYCLSLQSSAFLYLNSPPFLCLQCPNLYFPLL